MPKLTIFTATYNRAYILPKLYDSLQRQTNHDFEWILIDDGSTDETISIVNEWLSLQNSFDFKFFQSEHGGKIRAINKAVSLAKGKFFLIVDSDDFLKDDAVEWICSIIPSIETNNELAGFSGIRCKQNGDYIITPNFNGHKYIDCFNTERKKYRLEADMAEVYKTTVLKKYPFPIWDDEMFVPENVVWDKIALDGLKVRWFDKKIYVCEYLKDGLTCDWTNLRFQNPMGFAMSANTYLMYAQEVIPKLQLIGEILYCCFLKKNFSFIAKTIHPFWGYLLLPIGFVYYILRKRKEQI